MRDWLSRHGWRVHEVTLVNGEKRWEVFHWFTSKGMWRDDYTPFGWIDQQKNMAARSRKRARKASRYR